MRQIGETDRVTFKGRTFDVELLPHHHGQTYADCERDCPKGWQITTHCLLQHMRNDLKTRAKFRLLNIFEYVQNPDEISRQNGNITVFGANSVRTDLYCIRDSSDLYSHPGVRYVREISKTPNQ